MTQIDFGDFEDADSVDTAKPEPVPTARIYQSYRSYVFNQPDYDELSLEEQALLAYIFAELLDFHLVLNGEAGAIVIVTLARKFSGDPTRKRWGEITNRHKRKEAMAAEYILKRLARETGNEWDRS